MTTDDEITGMVVDAALGIHRKLGPGLLESAYEAVLASSLARQGLWVARQRMLPFEFEGVRFENALRVDMLVENRIVVELKSTEKLHPVHTKQVLTYLRLLDLRVGLLINFGGGTLREGVRRVVNNYRAPSPPVQDPSAPPRPPRLRVHRFNDPRFQRGLLPRETVPEETARRGDAEDAEARRGPPPPGATVSE